MDSARQPWPSPIPTPLDSWIRHPSLCGPNDLDQQTQFLPDLLTLGLSDPVPMMKVGRWPRANPPHQGFVDLALTMQVNPRTWTRKPGVHSLQELSMIKSRQ